MKKIFALGFFDGVHLGHQALLMECCRMAREQNAKACAITFRQHPQSLFVEQPPKLINGQEDRIWLMRRYGIGSVFTYPVTKEVMSMPWQDFLNELLECDAIGFVCGCDFRFGNRGEGSVEKLKAYCRERNLLCSIVEDQTLDGVRVSSTYIRGLLEAGNMEQAVRFLGHPHILSGKVVHGKALGRTLGTPTANIIAPEGLVLPRFGVYATCAVVDGRSYPAVTNIGVRPTVEGEGVSVEAYLLDFTGDLYGKEISLLFYRFLRPEQKFGSLEALKEQVLLDAQQVRELKI